MKTQHTPGPWMVKLDGTCSGTSHRIYVEYEDPDAKEIWQDEICDLPTEMVNESGDAKNYESDPSNPNWVKQERFEEMEANALLISSAPDMLEALQKIASWDSMKDHPIGKYAADAIRKATGVEPKH